jgi:hypothetical protein
MKLKTFITIFHANGKAVIHEVKEINNELIQLRNKQEFYVGIDPEFQIVPKKMRRDTIQRMYYARFGIPFVYDPRTNKFFSSERKRNILIERGIAFPIQISNNLVIDALIDPSSKDSPLWNKANLSLYPDLEKGFKASDPKKGLIFLTNFLQRNPKLLEGVDKNEYPIFTTEDVTSIECMRSEWFQIIESKAIETTVKAMSKIDSEKNVLYFFIILAVSLLLTVLGFLYYGNEGAFGYVIPQIPIALGSVLVPKDQVNLNQSNDIDKSVGKALEILVSPDEEAAEVTANINSKLPVSLSILLAYEKRLNELLGICQKTSIPLVKPMNFFSEMAKKFLHLTPSVASRRADKILEAFQHGALQRVPQYNPQMPFFGAPNLNMPNTQPKDRKGFGRGK